MLSAVADGQVGRAAQSTIAPDIAAITREALERALFIDTLTGRAKAYVPVPSIDVREALDSVAAAFRVTVDAGALQRATPRYPHLSIRRDTLFVCKQLVPRRQCVIDRADLTVAGVQTAELGPVYPEGATFIVWVGIAYAKVPGPWLASIEQEVIFRRGADGVWRFLRLGQSSIG